MESKEKNREGNREEKEKGGKGGKGGKGRQVISNMRTLRLKVHAHCAREHFLSIRLHFQNRNLHQKALISDKMCA